MPDVLPMNAESLWGVITRQSGLAGTPESVGECKANTLSRTLCVFEIQGVSVDRA